MTSTIRTSDKPASSEAHDAIRTKARELLALLAEANRHDQAIDTVDFAYQVLATQNRIAVSWCVDDVQAKRPDLNDKEAWQVLLECRDKHDADWGLNWTFIKDIADDLFPR